MPNEPTVVGERRDDNTHLLVVGGDGQYYGYFPETEGLAPVEPGEEWLIYQDADERVPEYLALEMEQPE
ncbi:MAG TPA: hypothetical protein VGW38_06420 [Chloroflexota bacterium]|nr:hypothetical protein [Chloroflexota bacterium]